MLQVFHNCSFRLMWRTRWVFMSLSAGIMIAAFAVMAVRGFNYGIDFAGGTAVQVKFRDRPPVGELRKALEAARLGDLSIQRIGSVEDNEVLIRVEQKEAVEDATAGEGGEMASKILQLLRSALDVSSRDPGAIDLNLVSELALRDWLASRMTSDESAGSGQGGAMEAARIAAALVGRRNQIGGVYHDIPQVVATPGLTPEITRLLEEEAFLGEFALRGVDFVGPTAGRELLVKTVKAIIGSVIGILLYVWLRFRRVAWGFASIVALVHDVCIAAGAMALTGKEFSLPVVAALLTILGYSINDTIVVFDRIRENLRLYRDYDFEEVVNASINQTLSRTVLTSVTLFVAVTALYLYGGDKLDPLSFCLMVGVIFGSYSSIFVASSLLVVIYRTLGPRYIKA